MFGWGVLRSGVLESVQFFCIGDLPDTHIFGTDLSLLLIKVVVTEHYQ